VDHQGIRFGCCADHPRQYGQRLAHESSFSCSSPLEPSEGIGLLAAKAYDRLSRRGEIREIHRSNGWRRPTGGCQIGWNGRTRGGGRSR
jgi:hypothetical protein